MFPIILERDTPIIDWPTEVLWATTLTDPIGTTASVRSDGLLDVDFGTVINAAVTPIITARRMSSVGLHITGPEAGDEYTAYAISCVALSHDLNYRPCLFMGESPATITNNATGDTVTSVTFLDFGQAAHDGGGCSLKADVTVVVAEKTADRAICIGIGIMSGAAAGIASFAAARLSVRRMVAPGPRVIDTRKQ